LGALLAETPPFEPYRLRLSERGAARPPKMCCKSL